MAGSPEGLTLLDVAQIAGAAGAVVAAVTTVVIFWLRSRWDRQVQRSQRTFEFIDEFFSDKFTKHRSSINTTREKVALGKANMEEIARGYVVGHSEGHYSGDEMGDGMNEHMHMDMMLYYLQRLSFAISKKLADEKELRDVLGYQLEWDRKFLLDLTASCRKICVENNEIEPPFCVRVEAVLEKLSSNRSRPAV